MPTELERELFELAAELDIHGPVLVEMAGDLLRAVAVLRCALVEPFVHNRAGFAVREWNAGADPRLELSTLELVWSAPTPALEAVAAAIARAGGFRCLIRD